MTLYKNGASTGSSCTVGNSQTGCTISGLSLAVNGTDTLVLVVNRTSGTSYTGTASTSYTTLGSWSGTWYVSVSANCASQTAGNCNTTPPAGTITSASLSFGSAIGGSSAYSVDALQERRVDRLQLHGRGGADRLHHQRDERLGERVQRHRRARAHAHIRRRHELQRHSQRVRGAQHASGRRSDRFQRPVGNGYTITAWGANTSAQLTGQSVTSATTKTLTVS